MNNQNKEDVRKVLILPSPLPLALSSFKFNGVFLLYNGLYLTFYIFEDINNYYIESIFMFNDYSTLESSFKKENIDLSEIFQIDNGLEIHKRHSNIIKYLIERSEHHLPIRFYFINKNNFKQSQFWNEIIEDGYFKYTGKNEYFSIEQSYKEFLIDIYEYIDLKLRNIFNNYSSDSGSD